MPPGYKPLPVQIPQGLIGDAFSNQGNTIGDYEKDLAMRRAAELANQSNEISVNQRQIDADTEKAIRDELVARYGNQDVSKLDPAEGFKIAQAIALRHGDIDKFAALERTQAYGGASNVPLSPEEIAGLRAQGIAVSDNATVAEARLRISAKNANTATGNLDIRAGAQPLINTLNYQKATGTEFHKLGDAELGKLQVSDTALQSVNEVNTLIDQLDPGLIAAWDAGRITDLYKDPMSPAYRMYARLDLLKKQVARMNDSGALTQLDVDMFAPLTIGSPVYDSKESLKQRMADLAKYIQEKKQAIIRTNEQGYRNMDRFKDPNFGQPQLPGTDDINGAMQRGQVPPPPPPGGQQPYAPPGSQVLGVDPATGLAIVRKR